MPKPSKNNLIVDVGNTLTKLAIFIENDLVHLEKHEKLSIELLANIYDDYNTSGAIVSSVGNFPKEFEVFLAARGAYTFFSHSTPLPIKNCYKTPKTLGSDRLAAVVAANALFPKCNSLVVDCGTAITYDIITDMGEYIGGAISPGIAMRFKALNQFTEKLPLQKIVESYPVIGTNTKDSILSGVLNGIVNEVDGYINTVAKQYSPLEIVFTGGDSFFFDKNLKNSIFVNPNLVLFGLNRIQNFNEQL